MATPTETIQTSIPSYLQRPIEQLVAESQILSRQGYQPYVQTDAQGNPIIDPATGLPRMRQRMEGFNPQQIAAFNRIAGMQTANQIRQASGMAGLAGLAAPQLSRYQAYGDRVPMGGIDDWGAGRQFDQSKIPSNFDWQAYVSAPQNADLIKAGIDTPEEAMRHYAEAGSREGRALGTPGSTFQSNAFYTPPSFREMPTTFKETNAPTLTEAQMQAPTNVSAPEGYNFERAQGYQYSPLGMGPAERVGLGALQQYRMGAPERIAGPAGPERVSGQSLQQFQMSPAQQVRAAELERLGMVGPRDVSAPSLQQFGMSPAERVGAERFGLGAMQEYMSPYMQGVVERQKQAAVQDYRRQIPGIGAASARAGGRGGTREALLESEARRGLSERMGDIEAQGLQQAYQQAASQFGQDRAAQMQAALANQQAGLTTGQQNLQAALQTQGLGAQQSLQAQLANQQMGYNVGAFNVGAEQQRQQLMAQQQLEAQRLNQQAGLTTGQQNLAAQLQTQGLSSQQALEIARLNQQGQLSTEQLRSEIARANQAAGMTADQANQQAALQVQQLGTQSGLQAALANQQAGLTMGQQNLAAEQARQQFMGQTGLQAALANQQAGQRESEFARQQRMQAGLTNQQMGFNVGQQNLQALINQRQFGAGQGLQSQQMNQAAQLQAQQQALAQLAQANQFNLQNAGQRAQYGLSGANLAEQSRQFGAGLGLQGLQQQLAAAGTLGGLGMQQYQQDMGINAAQLGAGGQQQAFGQELLNMQYQDFLNAQRLPYQQAEFMSGILRGLPATGQTQTLYQQPGSLFGQIAGVGLGLGSLFGGLGSTTGSK